VLPAYNEEHGLLVTLEGVREALREVGRPFEIVVVNDGSSDATPRLLAGCDDVRVVHHGENRGYGAALKAGIAAARHPLVVVMDADGTYVPAAIPRLVAGCDAADMVVGARVGARVHPTPARSTVKWAFRQYAQWLSGARIPDLNSGLRAFHRAVPERFLTVLPDGFSFTTTITLGALLEGLTVHFEEIDYLPRIGRSKVRPVRDTLRILRQLLRVGARFAPLRSAVALAVPLLAIGLASGLRHLAQPGGLARGDLAWVAAAGLALAAGAVAEQRVRRRRDLAAAPPAPRDVAA